MCMQRSKLFRKPITNHTGRSIPEGDRENRINVLYLVKSTKSRVRNRQRAGSMGDFLGGCGGIQKQLTSMNPIQFPIYLASHLTSS